MGLKKQLMRFLRKHPNIAKCVINMSYVLLYPNHQEEIEKSILDFSATKNINARGDIKRDILYSMYIYRVTASEYFLFDFANKNRLGRKQYIGNQEMKAIVAEITNTDVKQLLTSKYSCYERFQDFYKRDLCIINDDEEFSNFVKQHPEFIVKPVDSLRGNDIHKLDFYEEPEEVNYFFRNLDRNKTYIAEELICQSKDLGKFHPRSVNTVRVVTCCKNGKDFNILFTLFRMGIGDSIIDNANAGGILADIDVSSGIIVTNGYRENGETYICHPDTGIQIVGMMIPHWEDLMEMIKKLVHCIPEAKLVGWDMALTDQGWILIEANVTPAFTGYQMCTKSGIRREIEQSIGEIDI